MNRSLRLAALAALVAAGALAGCRTSTNTVDPAAPKGTPSPEAMKHTITDPSLSDEIVPVFYNKGKNPAGFTMVQLQVQNQTRSVARVNYRVEWFDTNGMLSGAPTQLMPLVIEAGRIKTIQATAPSPDYVDARISFLESTNN